MFYFIVLLLSVVVNESLVELFSKSVFFSPLRFFLNSSSNKMLSFFSRVIECPYCCSVWTAAFITSILFIFYGPTLLGSHFLDFFLFLFLCHRISNYLHDITDRYFILKKE